MGARGPAPKRSTERRRRNKEGEPEKVSVAGTVAIPKADKDWHKVARGWYESLEQSGQADFYEPSDWAMAYLIAESISRDLKPQVVAVPEETGEPVFATIPLKGASLAAYLKAMSMLLVNEADRRRVGIELERGGAPTEETPKGVTALDDYRRELGA